MKEMAEGLSDLWERELGFKINLVPISYDEYQRPNRESKNPLYFMNLTATSWLEFAKDAVDEGYIIIPEIEYVRYMELVEEAELEEDKEKQTQKIMEIDRLLVEKLVLGIPLWLNSYCE